MKYYKQFNTNKYIVINKNEINLDIIIEIDIVDKFTSEMYDLITLVAGKKLDFLDSYYKDNENDLKKHITIRINKKLIAYGRIEFDGFVSLLSNYQLNLSNDIGISSGCIHPSYRGNLFYQSIILLALRCAIIENEKEYKYKSVSFTIADKMMYLSNRVYELGCKQINDNKTVKVTYKWDNHKSMVSASFFQFLIKKELINNKEYLDKLDNLIAYSLLNNKKEFYKHLILFKNKSNL